MIETVIDIVKKNILVVIIFVALIIVMCVLIEKMILKKLEESDYKKDYSQDGLLLLYGREDCQTNKKYYGIDFWEWQKNKLKNIKDRYYIGNQLDNGLTIVDVDIYKIIVNKIFFPGQRFAKYKKEFRVYAHYFPDTNVGDIVYGDKVLRDKNSSIGTQINKTYYEFPKEVLDIIQKLIYMNDIKTDDRKQLSLILEHLQTNKYSEKENIKLIEIISNYSGVLGNVATIITFLQGLFIQKQ